MSTSRTRFSVCFFAVLAMTVAGLGQTGGYTTREPINATQISGQLTVDSSVVLDATTGAVVNNAAGAAGGFNPVIASGGSQPNIPTIDGLNTVPTFDGAFFAQAGPSSSDFRGTLWRYSMMGNSPLIGGTTIIPAKIDQVSLQLLNADGSVFKTVPYAPFSDLFLQSPNFNQSNYTSGSHIEYADAVHRAQFFNLMKPNWHTLLQPQVVNSITITVPFLVKVQLSNGTSVMANAYFTSTAADGSTVVFMLQPLFNFFFDHEFVNDIVNGAFTTDALNMMLFPNTYLFALNPNDPTHRGSCCVLGFHTYFFDPPTVPQDRWVGLYASWISPGIFKGGFQDVTALSHEVAESFADPFIDNATPRWQFPGVPPDAKVCQGNLEEGDPIEVLPNATVPITLRDGRTVFTYHPQDIPLVQWFEMGTKSNAIDGAFSYPDETALPHSAIPCPQ